MEIVFSGDLQAKLARLADLRGSDSSAIVVEAVERMLEHDEWFTREVEIGLKQAEAGEVLSHEEVGRCVKSRLAGH